MLQIAYILAIVVSKHCAKSQQLARDALHYAV